LCIAAADWAGTSPAQPYLCDRTGAACLPR
jgi:hypothetical protein